MSAALALMHRPVSYVGKALRLAFPAKVAASPRLVMNILGYFDESGTHMDSPAFALAGFLGTADNWGAFTFEWQKALDDLGIELFHMASFESRKPPFTEANGWTDEIRRERLTRLLAIIQTFTLGSVGVVLPMKDYNAAFPDGPAKERSGGPYGIAAEAIFTDTGDLVRPLLDDPWVSYTFEIGAVGAGQVQKAFQDNLEDENVKRPMRLGSLTFQSKRDFLPLQAADILAYELFKELPRMIGTHKRPSRFPLRVLTAEPPHKWSRMDADQLKVYREAIDLALVHGTGTWQRPPGPNPKAPQSPRRSTRDR